MDKFPQEYLGDAVYASCDGYHVWLHVGRHDAEPCVALEPSVIEALNRYYESILAKYAKKSDDDYDHYADIGIDSTYEQG